MWGTSKTVSSIVLWLNQARSAPGRCCRKSLLGGIYEDFLKLPMRSMRGDVWDHIASQKNDHGLSYRHYKASQRRSSPKITICEIFGVVRFSTFSTASVKLRRTQCEHMISALPSNSDIPRRSRHVSSGPGTEVK